MLHSSFILNFAQNYSYLDYLCSPVLIIMNSPESIEFLRLSVDKDSSDAIYIQIADGIIAAIKNGSLQPGTSLPSTRHLASVLRINRNTIVRAFEILSAEGWISTSERHGTIVSERLPLNPLQKGYVLRQSTARRYCRATRYFLMTVFPILPALR